MDAWRALRARPIPIPGHDGDDAASADLAHWQAVWVAGLPCLSGYLDPLAAHEAARAQQLLCAAPGAAVDEQHADLGFHELAACAAMALQQFGWLRHSDAPGCLFNRCLWWFRGGWDDVERHASDSAPGGLRECRSDTPFMRLMRMPAGGRSRLAQGGDQSDPPCKQLDAMSRAGRPWMRQGSTQSDTPLSMQGGVDLIPPCVQCQ